MRRLAALVFVMATVVVVGGQMEPRRLPVAITGQARDPEPQPKKSDRPPSQPTVEGCFNEHECCASMLSMGQCTHHRSDLKLWCPASCGYCTPQYDPDIECNDRHSSCASWAIHGRCQANEYWMSENCRRSCGKCSRPRADVCPGTQHDCSMAPSLAIRLYCEQLRKWDEGARQSETLGSEPALPPGSHSLADLG